MAQKTNFNVSPYFDDFFEKDIGGKDKDYYKVLFNPGKPIQARELNTLQSILQNQVETFGSHIFKEGSVVIPGNVTFDNQFYAVKLDPTQYGLNISSYLNKLVGKKIIGQNSGVTATVKLVQLPNSEVEYPTIYVKYINSDSDFNITQFQNSELLYSDENIEFNSSIITSGTPFASTIASNSTSIASAASIGEGVYFVRGVFARVEQQTIILDYYSNNPSYRVGLRVDETIVTAKDDSTLYDNAKGFTNYAAPGADRFKISLVLTKKLLTDLNDTDFIEILRVDDGAIKKIETKSNYSLIKDYLAQRTYDESGDYSVVPFQVKINNSLNNRLGNDGLFFSNEKTEKGNIPSDDLMCVKVSPGKSYIKGYDVEKTGVEILDVSKPRTKQTETSVNVPFQMGNLLRINNVSGSPKQKGIIYLQDRRKNTGTITTIGSARVYSFTLTDSAYEAEKTNWDLYLYDIQTYTRLTLNQSVSATDLPESSFVKGKSSGASGYAVSAGDNTKNISIIQTSGSFSVGEQILINGIETLPRTIEVVKVYDIEDIKSVNQPTSISGFSTAFVGDTQLDRILRTGTITITPADGTGISTATVSSPNTFAGISSDSIIRYQKAGFSTETYNRVLSVSPSLQSIVLRPTPDVSGVCDGSLPSSTFSGSYSLGLPKIRNEQDGFLYAQLPNSNISSVDLSSSTITFSAQTNPGFTHAASKTITVSVGDFNLGINSTTARFEAFDEERYSIFYDDGTIEKLTSDKVSFPSTSQITFSNISADTKTISTINGTFVKNGVQNKVKQFTRSKTLNIALSKNPQSGSNSNSSVNDGLTYNKYYGLRVQDEEISLNYPDVVKIISVYESLDSSAPVLDTITFNSISNVSTNAIIGENIIGSSNNAIARVVSKPSTDTLGIVYLNDNTFVSGETVTFEESNISTQITSINIGKYNDITNKFTLDKGQKEQYYDYSRLIRKQGETSPSKQLLVIFDYYSVSDSDNGDVFTTNSYDEERFGEDIPNIGKNNIRSTDTLDFRPRVSPFTSTSASPFTFSSRVFGSEPKILMSPNESALVGYDFYLGRIDKLYLDKLGTFTIQQGTPSTNPKEPDRPQDVMEIATITLPPYLYTPEEASITLTDNRRYTMRDIGKIEDRVENLERVTSLSLLELNTQTLQIKDAQNLDRFKTGFFVDDFKNTDLINPESKVNVDAINEELTTVISRNSINLKPVPAQSITDQALDLGVNFPLFDSNVQKTGDLITLKYESVDWIEQKFATKVENVNPFHVVSYNGTVTLNPLSDTWVRTIRLEDVTIRNVAPGFVGQTTTNTTDTVSSGSELFMRSRNTGFTAVNLKPLTRFYQFLDGNSQVDFIPKLIEIANDSSLQNSGSVGSFVVGETVVGTITSSNGLETPAISFRIAKSNHKEGPYESPSVTYGINPYFPAENISSEYSQSSKILNLDVESLSANVQGLYSGYLTIGMRLVGQTSGAVAYVKNLRLISDNNGFLSGSFFLRDPNSTPPPSVRIATGSKVYKLSSSSTNSSPLPGSQLISAAETIYRSEGTWEQIQRTTTVTPSRRVDPLAQSFTVGGSGDTLNGNTPDQDSEGAYLTAIDLFFANKDPNNAPLTVEIRTVELGIPTSTIIGKPKILNPSDIRTSANASVATKVIFDYPIYLAPNLEYAIVLLAPETDQYEVWIAQMGEKTIETSSLPDSQAVRYSSQFAIGSLFKSQNGSIWTPNQYQDLKFKLYKAKFTSSTGSALFHNPTLNQSNGYVPTLRSNPIVTLPNQIKVGITTITSAGLITTLSEGRKVSSSTKTYNYGYIVGTGSSVSSINITDGGSNYVTSNDVSTYPITGRGSGLKLNITNVSAGTSSITTLTIANPGNGYAIGDVVGIVTSSLSPSSGNSAKITVSNTTGLDTLYLSNVQGQSFDSGSNLVYYDNSGNSVSLSSTSILSSTPVGGVYSGNFFKVNHFNHGMYANNNKLTLSYVKSDVPPTTLSAPITSANTTISVASTSNFTTFEGVTVGPTNPGFVLIQNELIKYEDIGPGQLTGITRNIDSTIAVDHPNNSAVYKYEVGGVSLRRINKTHDISDTNIEIDSYNIEINRSNFDSNVTNRSSDNSLSGAPQLSFNGEKLCGGTGVNATENIQFSKINPQVALSIPSSSTAVNGQIRTVSGTSVNGNESSFVDQQYESVQLGVENTLNSTRIVCSNINEQTYLASLPRNKSFTLKLDLSTSNQNLSPAVFWKESSVELVGNRLNHPITDYSSDNRVNSLVNDPHAAVYISNVVNLAQPATALKVIVSAYRHSSADFRVLYSLIRPGSSEIQQEFELFPGYDNLTIDNNLDGYFDVVNPSRNSGLSDVRVPDSLNDEFLDYEFSANRLGSFTGYVIKIVMSGTDQSKAPRFKDLRTIALA